MSDLLVLVPDGKGGADLCDVGQLLAYLEDGDDFEQATGNAIIDSLARHYLGAEVREHLDQIAALNKTGDATAYWKARQQS